MTGHESEKKSFKVVICGPPHSGKSVFTQQLRRLLLPLGCCGVIESCPDGEGGWSNVTDQSLVSSLRVKGKFTSEFVSWVLDSLTNCPQPLVLADVGGVRSPENQQIFQACNAFIVVANPAKEGELAAWEEFGKANGCKPIALLNSILTGETVLDSTQDGIVRGTQAGLERGEKVGGAVIEAVVNTLLDMIGRPKFSAGELEANVHTGQLADQLGISCEERDARLGFRPWHAPAIRALSSQALAQNQCRIWGVCPGWLPALLASCSSGVTQLWDIRLGWVEIPELALTPEGSKSLDWEVTETDDFTVVKFQIPGGVFDIRQLADVTAPSISAGKTVVINGRGPHWLTTAIAWAYAQQDHEVAILSLHESSMQLPDGTVWANAHPGMVPAVAVTGKKIGQLLAVPNGH